MVATVITDNLVDNLRMPLEPATTIIFAIALAVARRLPDDTSSLAKNAAAGYRFV